MQKIVCFHNPDEENGYLSNWCYSEFIVDSQRFSSMEQYMMYQKAIIFRDTETGNEILGTGDVGKIKMLGRSVRNYEESIWNGVRQIVVYEGLLHKFTQNISLQEKLLSTGDSILAECAVKDCIWGIGLSMKDEKRYQIREWRGQNLLGYTLMKVRSKIAARCFNNCLLGKNRL